MLPMKEDPGAVSTMRILKGDGDTTVSRDTTESR